MSKWSVEYILISNYFRKSIQESIYQVTQVTSMNILTKAIKNDIGTMIKDNKEMELQLKDQKQRYQCLNFNYQDSLKRNDELLVKVQELEELEQGRKIFIVVLYICM